MTNFLYHDNLRKEIDDLSKKRFRNIKVGLSLLEKLCAVQFCPEYPKQLITPAKLHRVAQNDMWKVELVIPNSGLRPNQLPRLWFAVKGSTVGFLSISDHIVNYNDEEMDRQALFRITDIF